mmetsp:Transcript_10852/g.21065  ORF Transcript_10852/g.21065 Transcript_10852/m.21065 type:complete len:214 (+) Transcript_10852:731-1372(+)
MRSWAFLVDFSRSDPWSVLPRSMCKYQIAMAWRTLSELACSSEPSNLKALRLTWLTSSPVTGCCSFKANRHFRRSSVRTGPFPMLYLLIVKPTDSGKWCNANKARRPTNTSGNERPWLECLSTTLAMKASSSSRGLSPLTSRISCCNSARSIMEFRLTSYLLIMAVASISFILKLPLSSSRCSPQRHFGASLGNRLLTAPGIRALLPESSVAT